MNLIIVRHAIALDRDKSKSRKIKEGDRPLTSRGIKKFKKTCRLLREIDIEADMIFTSPWLRAHHTAQLFRRELRQSVKVKDAEWMLPHTPSAKSFAGLVKYLKLKELKKKQQTVVVVGHEPHLSKFLQYCLAGSPRKPTVELKKGAVAQLHFAQTAKPGQAMLQWLVVS